MQLRSRSIVLLHCIVLTLVCAWRRSCSFPDVCAAEMQGYRTNMEDAHSVALQLPNHPNVSYIGQTRNELPERDEGGGVGRLQVGAAPCGLHGTSRGHVVRPSQRCATC